MIHLLGIAASMAFIIICTLLPFLPGRHDSLAVPLSLMAQVAGTAGLAVVPFGMLWIVAARWQRFAGKRHILALLALIATSLVWVCVCLAGAAQSGFALGIVTFAPWGYVARKAWPDLTPARGATPQKSAVNALPFYLVIVPVAVALLQLGLLGPAVAFSRDRAIRNSAPLIEAIEQYRMRHGRYPASLLSVNPDYWPGVIGIAGYHYEPNGDAYNLLFEQFTHQFGTREFVMYNPRDEHVMTSHAMDILELPPEQLELERTRGHYAVHNARQPHWKYFWFD
jgi:hypothetical protein